MPSILVALIHTKGLAESDQWLLSQCAALEALDVPSDWSRVCESGENPEFDSDRNSVARSFVRFRMQGELLTMRTFSPIALAKTVTRRFVVFTPFR